ncbi:MAG: S-methyl-5-thioribose kinase [Chloroflexota bacterium]
MYTPLTAESVIDYVVRSPIKDQIFHDDDTFMVEDLAEGGNINLIFRVRATEDRNRSVLVKQALPHSRRYPDIKMPLSRAEIEYNVLAIENQYCPGIAPQVYHYDGTMYVNLMEDLNDHLIMRKSMEQQITYPKFAEDMAIFLARSLFYTSDLFLSSADKKAEVPKYINPVLCKVTEDLFFTQPVVPHDNNRWTSPDLDALVDECYANESLFAAMLTMKEKFMNNAQALIHGDFHTGSIMLNKEETRVIDPEFAFYGPMAFDTGSLIGNLMIGYGAQEGHAPDEESRRVYRQWLLQATEDFWTIFEQEFRRLWDKEADPTEWGSKLFQDQYMAQLLQDTAGFAGAELFRRTIGLAHVDDFIDISDQSKRAASERIALEVGQRWLLERANINSIGDLLAMIPRQ